MFKESQSMETWHQALDIDLCLISQELQTNCYSTSSSLTDVLRKLFQVETLKFNLEFYFFILHFSIPKILYYFIVYIYTIKYILFFFILHLSIADLPKKAMTPHSSTLAWKIPWTEEPGRLQSMGSHRVGHN